MKTLVGPLMILSTIFLLILSYQINTPKRDIFFPKIYLRNLRYYPPQNDILTYSKGGYGGRGGVYPHAKGGVPHPLVIHMISPPHMVGVWINKFVIVRMSWLVTKEECVFGHLQYGDEVFP